VPEPKAVVQDGDVLFMSLPVARLFEIRAILAAPPSPTS